jgi:aryl-alcohol dehydrogenase-like predicted oxidoreductase
MKQMDYLRLGRTDLEVSRLALGGRTMGGMSHDPRDVESVLRSAHERGINFFDTADIYSLGDSERLLGRIIRDRRDRVIISTKVGTTMGKMQFLRPGVLPYVKKIVRRWGPARRMASAAGQNITRHNFDPKYIGDAIDGCLHRLGTDYIDLLLLHHPPIEALAGGNVSEALTRAQEQGKIRYYGISCSKHTTPEQVNHYLDFSGVSVLQTPAGFLGHHLFEGILPRALDKEIGLVARAPFGEGALFKDPDLLDAISELADGTAAQIVIRFALQINAGGAVLVGTTRKDHLDENLDALALPPLSPEVVEKIRSLALRDVAG